MSLVVTGASGQLGRLVISHLLADGTPAAEIVAVGRNSAKLGELAKLGVQTRTADYGDPARLSAALEGASSVLLISGSEVGQRVGQHRAVIEAAVAAGANRIVYTSAPQADTSALVLAPEHKATEALIRESGLDFTILRNGWYTENYLGAVNQAATTGEIVASVGAGRVASASRDDYARAAASVLAGSGHDGATYELSGDEAWSHEELAAVASELLEKPVVFRNLEPAAHVEALRTAGLDEATAGFVVALDGNIRDGLLAATSGELARLIARPTTPLREGLSAGLQSA